MISYQESTAQQGVSEQQFFKILQQYFPHISPGLMFAIPDSKYHYSTDFSLIDPTTGLSIDIEIDEPYEGRTKQPHHCLDQGKDRNRNQFFLAGNWVVIRFAEIQVVKYPHACAAAIASVLTQITGEDCYIKQFETIEPLPRVKPWTTAEARKMARKNFRQNYLNEMGIFVSSQKTRKKRSDRKK
ncbi:MAG TPA: hypothetical protein DD379_20840 [Cyanobacteria bacterium UBA11162]|nr:hypothetical protein [Cyanobacteria bacterium UBA11162]